MGCRYHRRAVPTALRYLVLRGELQSVSVGAYHCNADSTRRPRRSFLGSLKERWRYDSNKSSGKWREKVAPVFARGTLFPQYNGTPVIS